MKKKILLIILSTLFVVLFSNTSLASFYPDENITLYGICINGSTEFLTSNATITIWYPNSTLLLENQNMTEYDPGRFNYNLTTPNITGTYQSMINCSVPPLNSYGWDSFVVSADIDYWHISVILGLFGIVAIFLLLSTNFEELWYLKALFYAVSLFFASLGISMVNTLIPNNVNMGILNSMTSIILTWSIYIFITYLLIYTTVFVVRSMIDSKKKKRNKGMIDEDFKINGY